jgi:hypothetical protein
MRIGADGAPRAQGGADTRTPSSRHRFESIQHDATRRSVPDDRAARVSGTRPRVGKLGAGGRLVRANAGTKYFAQRPANGLGLWSGRLLARFTSRRRIRSVFCGSRRDPACPVHPKSSPDWPSLECPVMGGDVAATRRLEQFSLSPHVQAAFRVGTGAP